MPKNREETARDDTSPTFQNTGMVLLDPYQMKRLRLAQGLTIEAFVKRCDGRINTRTARKVFRGEPVQMSVALYIQEVFGVKNLLDIIDPSEYARPGEAIGTGLPQDGLREWIAAERPSPILTASNDLQYRIYKLRHRYLPDRLGRGKRYELFHLPSDEQERLRHQLVRHLQVCERVCRHSAFPICHGTFPEQDGNVWWVIDRWVEGGTLDEALNLGPLPDSRLPVVMTALAKALGVLHAAGVVRRELSPKTVLLQEDGPAVMLTDFELAKLTDRGPTVSTRWPEDPYRAPEIATGDTDLRADLYSWARILVQAATGKLPSPGADVSLLETVPLPRAVFRIAKKCLARPQSQRPQDVGEILQALRRWT